MKMILDDKLLAKYFRGEKRHTFYNKSVELAHSVNIHASGDYPTAMIEERRPSESEFIKKYRAKIWKPITMETISQVVNELMKIRKADDWSVKFDITKFSKSIRQGETPDIYFEKKIPHFESVTNWAFAVLLQTYLCDANAVLLTLPLERVSSNTDYRRPYPFLFKSENVIGWQEDEFCILRSKDKSNYTEDGGAMQHGEKFYVVTKEHFLVYRQINSKGEFAKEEEYPHGLGYMPAFKLKAVFCDYSEGDYLWKSRLYAMIPRLDEAVREYSDLQAEVVQHIHSEKWVIQTQNCTKCSGTGKVRQGNPIEIVACPQCRGAGTVATSPYSNMVLKPAKVGEQPVPIPPAGYIQKDIEIVKIQDERIDKHIYKALCAINMQYLDKVPMNQSGVAKEVDKESLNNFVHSVAEDIVRIMDRFIATAMDYRYKDVVADEMARKEMLPVINVPSKLDVLSASYLVDEIGKLKSAKVNPIIINATEVELANKKFSADPEIRDTVLLTFELDPLSGYTQDEKMTMLSNRGITTDDYVISCNINRFVKELARDTKFFSLSPEDKMKKLREMAQSIISSMQVKLDTSNKEEEEEE